jgi:AraC-like DNA-binding protein
MNFNTILFGLGILNLSLVLILTTKQSAKFPPQKWLILFFGVWTLDIFSEMIIFNKPLIAKFPYLEYLPTRLNLFYGACLLTYVEVVMGIKHRSYWWIRFLPTAFYFLIQSFYFITQKHPQGIIENLFFQDSALKLVFSFGFELYFLLGCLRLLKQYPQIHDTLIIEWLNTVVKTILFIISLFFIKNFMEEIGLVLSFVRLGTLTLPLYLVAVFFLIYHTLRIPVLVEPPEDTLKSAFLEENNPVIITNQKQEIKYANGHFLQVFGYLSHEVNRRHLSQLISQEALAKPTSQSQFTTSILTKNGSTYLSTITVNPYFEDNSLSHYIYTWDFFKLLGSPQPDSEDLKLLDELKACVGENKFYRNAKIQLSDVATFMNMSPRKISFILNKYETKTFSDFINAYRVDAVIAELESDAMKTKTIEAIALENGFGTKSNFYSVFKKNTGKTPNSYILKSEIK